jgi:hypothetical protein
MSQFSSPSRQTTKEKKDKKKEKKTADGPAGWADRIITWSGRSITSARSMRSIVAGQPPAPALARAHALDVAESIDSIHRWASSLRESVSFFLELHASNRYV